VSEPIDPSDAFDLLKRWAPIHAKSKAERIYLEEFRKTRKAQLMKDAEVKEDRKSAAAQEVYAYSHAEYISVLEGLRAAVEAEELARWRCISAQAALDVWRSQEASARAEGRAAA